MSIKSQKSLNDECSEIFERSYSVRSVSDDSLTCDDDEDTLSRELLRKLTPAVLSQLRRSFKRARARSAARDIDRRVEEVMRAAAAEEGIEFASSAPAQGNALCLDEGGFVSALDNIFGHHRYTTHAHKLFQTLDQFGSGRVWWQQLVGKMVATGARQTGSRSDGWQPAREGGMLKLDHCKRETIVKLVSIEREDSFCYAAVSKGGRVGVYSGELKLLNSYEVFFHRTGLHRRVKNCWITDAVYLNDVQSLLLAASDRSLTVYDVTTLTHAPVFCITGLPNIPTCLAYCPACATETEMSEESELMFGTERGDLVRIRFLQPRISLFHMKTTDTINNYFWMELSSPPHSSYCTIMSWRKVHSRSIRRAAYARDGHIVVSCSHDSAVGVRARHAPGQLQDYVFRVQRGVSCFHVVPSLHLLATGGRDGALRLWDTTQASPFATFSAPGAPAVLDVAVLVAADLVLGYFSNCAVNIWDLYEECLLQTIKLKFPFLGVLGKKIDFGTFCIHPGPTRKKRVEEEEEPPGALSRRGSSVCRAATGGLLLQPPLARRQWDTRPPEEEPEYIRYNRPEVLITCCDYVCTLVLKDTDDAPLPPPGDTLRARRPSFWELPSNLLAPPSPSVPAVPKPAVTSPRLLEPSAAECLEPPELDLDDMLEKAGLQGILEKDFVLMQGLKHDLNKKLFEMEADMEATRSAVSAGAPHLALRSLEPAPLPPPLHLAEHWHRVLKNAYASGASDIFKFFSDEKVDFAQKYPVLDEQDYTRFLSKRALRREPALTRQITSLAYKVGKQMISLAEGMPNEEIFPFNKLVLHTKRGEQMVIEDKEMSTALQYVPSQGLPSLLEQVRSLQQQLHRPPAPPPPGAARDVLVTNGAQHGIYQCVEMLVDPGDPVLTTEYSYTGIHSTLKPFQAEIVGIPEDENGLIPETLESILEDRLARGLKMPRMLYLIPTGNNPTGTVLSVERRKKTYELACRYDFLIVEDDPYMFLNYSEEPVPSFLSMDVCGRVVRLDSVSKVVSAGLRGGWLAAPTPLVRRAELHAQAELLHPCTLSQSIVSRLLSERAALMSHLRHTRAFYGRRRDALRRALRPLRQVADWVEPSAGLFYWVRVRGVDDVYNMVFHTAFQRGLMLVPGQAFQHDTSAPCQYLRLTFSKIPLQDMDTAVSHLVDIIRDEQKLTLQKRPQRFATER